MKRLMIVAVVVLALASLGVAGEKATLSGYLVDKMCGAKPERAANHSKSCTEKCAGSGLGVVADGKFVSFDEKGNQLGADLLKNSKQTKGVKVTVEGTQDGETLKVSKITEPAE
jgi:hypothetical protein